MDSYRYLIIGGGMTADSAVKGIRKIDPEGSIGLISQEDDPPYNRPPLSKGLWKGKPFETIWRGTAESGATLHLGRRATGIDPRLKQAEDNQGGVYKYEKLLLATGAKPRRLENDGGRIIYYRTAADYRTVRSLADQGKRFAVIGGGYIGSEIAAALAMNGVQVSLVFPERGIGARLFPADLAESLRDYYREKGVDVRSGVLVVGISAEEGQTVLRLDGGDETRAEAVIAGLGVTPNTQLAVGARLEVDEGVVVDDSLRTSDPDIYAAGDVANFYNPSLDTRIRVEHEDNANTMGEMAGRSMAGESIRYDHLPYFYSDLFDLGYEAVGVLDSSLETQADWTEPYRKGVIYYLDDGRVRGVLLWNVWDQVPAARALIAEPGPFKAGDLYGRIPR